MYSVRQACGALGELACGAAWTGFEEEPSCACSKERAIHHRRRRQRRCGALLRGGRHRRQRLLTTRDVGSVVASRAASRV